MRKDQTVLITGCSSGIGYAAARTLQERGYRVFASARKPEDVARLAAEGLETLQLDLRDSDSIHAAVETLLERTDGRLYALFNNGAFGQHGAVEDLSRDVLRAQFETNLFGWQELTNLVLPVMRRQGEGRIIQNSSVLGFVALPFRGAYISSKFALEGLSDTLRLELQGTGIHVCLIEPGPIESRFRENAHALFKQNIDAEHSPFREQYRSVEERLKKQGHAAPFTLTADAVVQKLIHALESERPKARYYVTVPTHLFGNLRRFMSTRMLDRLLMKVSGSGSR